MVVVIPWSSNFIFSFLEHLDSFVSRISHARVEFKQTMSDLCILRG